MGTFLSKRLVFDRYEERSDELNMRDQKVESRMAKMNKNYSQRRSSLC